MEISFDYDLFGVIPVTVTVEYEMTTFALNDPPQAEILDVMVEYEGQNLTDDIDDLYRKRRKTTQDGEVRKHDAKVTGSNYDPCGGKLSVDIALGDYFQSVMEDICETAFQHIDEE